MPPRYQKLLDYFAKDVLASLSCHPSIHDDLCKGLMPAMFHSPHLLSASLALSAAGFLSRGLSEVEGTDIVRVLQHLQSSGLALLRKALAAGEMNEVLFATCLIWCLADVFAGRREGTSPSWRIHLKGIKAILEDEKAYDEYIGSPGCATSATRHLYMLYLSLLTLPCLPSTDDRTSIRWTTPLATSMDSSKIDGFLGYSVELLHLLQHINQYDAFDGEVRVSEAEVLLGKVTALISRDADCPPAISISSSLSSEFQRNFSLCHGIFQQATLIHLYRRLYKMPSRAPPIQIAVETMSDMIKKMTQGKPCNTWVAMAMPLFTIGCEAFSDSQQSFILDKIQKFASCLGSMHVQIMQQALEEIWRRRAEREDARGSLCTEELLRKWSIDSRASLLS